MTLGTRLLPSGAASFLVPAAASIPLTSAGEGGWNQQSDYKAASYNGRTYFAWVASDGDVKIATYVHATETVEDEFTLHAALQVNVHISPSILVRASDHKLIVAYTKHDQNVFYVRISTNPEDTSAWGAEVNLHSTLGGTTYTYPSIFQRDSGTIILFYRDVQGLTTGVLCYTYSTNGGTTWHAQTELLKDAGELLYWKVYGDGERIDVVSTNGHPVTSAPTKLYHMWANATTWHTSDGTPIAGAFPYDTSDMTEIYDGSDGSAWAMSVTRDGSDDPAVVYWTGTYGDGDMDVVRSNWNGASWDSDLVANEGAPGSYYAPGGAVMAEGDPDTVFMAQWNGSRFAMFRKETSDGGTTWGSTPLDVDDTEDAIWPAVVRDAAPGLRAVWLSGDIVDDDTYTLAIRGTP